MSETGLPPKPHFPDEQRRLHHDAIERQSKQRHSIVFHTSTPKHQQNIEAIHRPVNTMDHLPPLRSISPSPTDSRDFEDSGDSVHSPASNPLPKIHVADENSESPEIANPHRSFTQPQQPLPPQPTLSSGTHEDYYRLNHYLNQQYQQSLQQSQQHQQHYNTTVNALPPSNYNYNNPSQIYHTHHDMPMQYLPQIHRGFNDSQSDTQSDFSHDVSGRDIPGSGSISHIGDSEYSQTSQSSTNSNPTSESVSTSISSTQHVIKKSGTKTNTGKERIVIIKQNLSELGDFKIDRHGRIIVNDGNDNSVTYQEPPTNRSRGRNSVLASFVTNTLKNPSADTDIKYKERDVQRESKWIEMLTHWQVYTTKRSDVLKKRIRKGIPASLRGVVWPSLVGISEIQASKPLRYYQSLLAEELDEGNDLQIRKDLPRMSQDHVMFRSPEAGSRVVMCHGQASLYNILKAYAIHDRVVGYVQGMDSVAVAALLYFPEETAFWYLERLLNNPIYNLRDLYIEGMPLAHKYMFIHDNLVRKYAPKVYSILSQYKIVPMTYAFRWYSMRFSQFDPTLSYRILDIYLYEGDKILYRVALALLLLHEAKLVAAADSHEVMEILSSIEKDRTLHIEEHGDLIIDKAVSIAVKTDVIIKYSQRFDDGDVHKHQY